jgi:hypothetical protein
MKTIQDILHEMIARELLNNGKLVNGGWEVFDRFILDPSAPTIQREEMRKAFFAGAQHVYMCLCSGLDPDEEPTADDMKRMELLEAELIEFGESFAAEIASNESKSH